MSTQKTNIEQLYTSSYQRMLTMARLMLKDEKEAEDIVSDLFARLADGTVTLPSERPESYLLVAIRNKCLAAAVTLRPLSVVSGKRASAHHRDDRLC